MAPHNRPTALLISLFGAVFAAAAGTHALTPLFPELRVALGVDGEAVRQLTVVYTLGYSVAGFLLGILCDHLGRRRILLGALLVYVLTSLVLLLPLSWTGYPILLLARAGGGLASGGMMAAAIALTSDLVSERRRGRALSWVLAGSHLAVVVGVPLSAYLARFRLLAVFALLLVVAAIAWVVLLLRAPTDIRGQREPGGLLRLPLRSLAAPGVAAATLSTLCSTLAAFAFITSLADHCVDAYAADLNQRAVLFLLLGVGALVGGVVAGLVSDRLGRGRFVVAALCTSMLLGPLLLLPATFPTFVAVMIPVALVQTLRQGPFAAVLTSLVPTELRGSAVGWNSLAAGLGLSLGTWLGAVGYSASGLAGVVVVAVAALLLSLLLFWLGVLRVLARTGTQTGSVATPESSSTGGPDGREEAD